MSSRLKNELIKSLERIDYLTMHNSVRMTTTLLPNTKGQKLSIEKMNIIKKGVIKLFHRLDWIHLLAGEII